MARPRAARLTIVAERACDALAASNACRKRIERRRLSP
jgi:hypothetical protein